MKSKKRSSWAKEAAAFKSSLNVGWDSDYNAVDDLFAQEAKRDKEQKQAHQDALRTKACNSKNRYDTKAEAEEIRAHRESQGARGLHVYHCQYCDGWHLTSHEQEQ